MSYIDNIVKFHTFSKSTVRENLTLGEAVNPSGHTVTAKQIRTQDIPAFIYSFQTTQADALTWAEGNIDAYARHNDILYWGSQFNMGFELPNCLIRVAKVEDENGKVIGELPSGTKPYWKEYTLSDKNVLKNSAGDPVITIHKGCKISYVHGDNNAAVNSNKFAAFVKTNDGRILDHFISPTDQIIGGQPSLGYNLLLFKDGQGKALTEGEELKKDNYIANAYAGIIHFMDERTETYDASKNYEVNGFNVYCYEYTGNKLDSMLTESTAELKDYVDNEINKAIEYRTVNITKGTDNIEIEYKDTTDGDGNPGTYTISVDGYTTSEIDAIKDNINGALDDHIDDSTIHVTDNDKSRWNEAEELLDEHTNDSTIHVTGNDKSRWNKAEGLLDEHIIDSTMHVTSNDKLRWNEAKELLDEHIDDDNKHVTEEDRERWDKGGSAIQSISQGDYINISETNTISVTNVTSNIVESEDSSLTTAASVREYVKDINDNNTISDVIWNLNDLLVSCINDTDKNGAKWVQELLRYNATNNSTLISIINYESIYNTTNIVEATEKWITEALAENTKLSTDLAFRQDSFMTNQLFRLFFYNLDHKFGKTYGSDDSISRKFMKRGLTFKYLAKVESNPVLNYPNEGFGKPRYKYITLRYRGKTIDGTDKPLEIDWNHIPTIDNTVKASSTADTFQMAKAWDIIDSEEYGNNVYINGDDFINAEGNGNTWDLNLNVASDITKDNQNLNDIKSSTVPTTAAVIDRISDDIQYHANMFSGHMTFGDQKHSIAGGTLRTLISEKIEPANPYTYDYQPNASGGSSLHTKIYLDNRGIFDGFIKEITFTNSSCEYNGEIYVKIMEYPNLNTFSYLDRRFIGIFKFDSSRDGGLKVVFTNGFKVDSEHDYLFTFHNTSEGIDKNAEDGNVSLNLSRTNEHYHDRPMFYSRNDHVGSGTGTRFAVKIKAIDYKIPTSNAVKNYTDKLIENKVEALPSVYTGNNDYYINCYGFEYTNPSENIILDKIEIKFAKNLDTLKEYKNEGAPDIPSGEVENNICKITVAKVKTPEQNDPVPSADDEIEIATSDYNTNISKEVNLSQFKFSKNIILEKGWNYRFYFYDKNDNLFAASVIVNTVPYGDTLLPKNSVANRYLSERYDYWGAYQRHNTIIALNGLAVKLINSVQEHINNQDINLQISGDDFITPEKTDTGWNLTLNNSTDISSSNIDGDKKVPTVSAIHNALYGYETTVVPQTYNTVWDNITAGTQVANTGGFYFSVDQTTTCNAIEIRQIVNNGNTAFSSAYIKIWDKASGSLLSKSPAKTTLSGGEGDTWDIDEMTFSPGIEYLITFNDNNTSSQFSAGYSVRFDKMASNLGAGYGLLNSGTLNAAHEGICPKVILKTLIPGSTSITKIVPEGLYDKHQTHINDTFVHNNAIVDGLYDKTDNVVSYQEGLITYTDGTTENKDISDSVSAVAAFRTSSGITPNLVSFNTRPELVDENGEPTSNIWYDGNNASKFDYEMDANAHSVAVKELSSLGSLINGSWMFTRSGLTMFNDDVNCLTNGTAMFFNSKNLSRFKSALPSLTVGQWMFKGCNLKEFKSKMPALSIAQGMFADNENLTTFNSSMPNLTVAIDMFYRCPNLTTFIVPPSSLKNLYYSRAMFKSCNNLNIFTGSLEALEEPYWMFNNCKLSLESIRNIANTVKDYTGIYQDNLTHDFGPIGIDCLADEYDNSEFNTLIDKIRAKGWALSLQFNKSTRTLNLDEPGNAPTNILYVKKENLGETLNEYIDENLNTWALTYANKVYDLEGWTIFSSVEEAAEAWKLTPVSR